MVCLLHEWVLRLFTTPENASVRASKTRLAVQETSDTTPGGEKKRNSQGIILNTAPGPREPLILSRERVSLHEVDFLVGAA